MDQPSIATVVGGSGFIGRYVVQRLAARGHVVRVAVRDPEAARFLRVNGPVGQIVPLFASLDQPATLARAVEGAAIVVNLVGILAERRPGDFDLVQGEGAGALAQAASAAGVAHFAHVSAIGADPASLSAYGRSKAHGEALVQAHFPAASILRPSIVFGAEDKFFNRFAQLATLSPVMPVIAGETLFQPVYVGDVADAVLAALDAAAGGMTYTLGGPRVWTFRELLGWIVQQTGRHRPLLGVPPAAARLLARIPFSGLTTDQLLMLGQDNVADPARPGLAELGITPTPVELVVPAYLARYRKGGRRRAAA